jgi:hypothetical protein
MCHWLIFSERSNAREREFTNGLVSILEQHKTQFRAFC